MKTRIYEIVKGKSRAFDNFFIGRNLDQDQAIFDLIWYFALPLTVYDQTQLSGIRY